MPELRFHFLGAPHFERLDAGINFERRKSVALLAYLSLTGQPHTRDALAALLWPDYQQQNSRTTLRQVLSDIRQKLGDDCLEIGRADVGINPNHSAWVDVVEFRNSIRLPYTHGHSSHEVCAQCVEPLSRAVKLYRGDFLTGFTVADSGDFDDWQSFQTEQLRLELFDSLDRLIQYHIRSRLVDEGIAYARRWLSMNSLDERPHRHLMQLYAAIGQKAAANNQFNACKQIIEAAGLTLEPETLQLHRQISEMQSVLIEKPLQNQPASSVAAQKSKLPSPPNTFVGREKELEQVYDYLSELGCRFLTLLGAPGVGKTRLSIQAAGQLLHVFPDGVFFVPLASINDPSLFAYTLTHTLGLQERGEASILDLLKAHLATKSCLLVLDNFEHLLAAAPVIGDILSAAPQVKILVTSREPLELYGEHEYIVPPLSLPNLEAQSEKIMRNDAVKLFAQRAEATSAGFRLTRDNALSVAKICTRLDGLPLAIELAATRIKLYSPVMLLKLLDQRLNLLTSTIRNLPPRHQTLRSAIEWSYSLLGGDEATLFRRLGAFVGGWSVNSMEIVCSAGLVDVSDKLEALINKSLVQTAKRVQAEPRFEMLETLREYALEKLVESGEELAIHTALTSFFVKLIEQAVSELRGPNQRIWLQRLEDDYDNLRAVMTWLLEKDDIETLQQLGNHLAAYWHERGYLTEGRYWLESTLSGHKAAPIHSQAEAFEVLFSLSWTQGDYVAAERYAAEYLILARTMNDEKTIGTALYSLGGVALAVGKYAAARTYYEESRKFDMNPKKLWSTSFALTGIGEVAYLQGDYPSARFYYQEDLQRAQESGSPQAISAALNGLAKVTDMQGDYESAQIYAKESLLSAEKVGNQQGIAIALNRLGRIVRQLGSYAEAKLFHEKSLSLAYSINNSPIIAFTLNKLGETAADEGDYQKALKLHTKALALNREMNDPYYIADNLYYLATISLKLRNLDDALYYMTEALQIAAEIDALVVLLQVFACFTEWHIMKQMFDTAAELLGFLSQNPAVPAQVRRTTQWFYHDLENIMPPEQLLLSFDYGKTQPLESIINLLLRASV